MADTPTVSDGRYLMVGGIRILDTQSIATVVPLTDNSGGTPGAIVTVQPGAYSAADEANFRATVAAQLNAIVSGLKAHGLFT